MTHSSLEHIYTDVAIIGSGGAGLRAAVAAADGGLSVLVLSKVPPARSHTVAAQGGINAALGNRTPDDWQWHMYDTIRGGDWLSDQDAVAMMCEQAPAAILELEHMGMAFTRQENGQIYQRAYGGQYTHYGKGDLAYRACAVADRTGHALLHMLYATALRSGVSFFSETMALSLLFDREQTCIGLLAWKLETGELIVVHAKRTIIATGGFGQAWTATTSSSICTGDGNAMILKAGLPLQDMEFVQFHPTSLYGTGILITEGARGEGGHLYNGNGERFMLRYAESMELASRDVVSRAMLQEILAGRGCGEKKDHLYLKLDHLAPEHVLKQLPSVCQIAKTFARIDALRDPIPVIPAAHYTMGGIPSNADSEVLTVDSNGTETTVQGILVIGEAACNSVHGANRLGCNSLLDLVVFGRNAGLQCVDDISAATSHPSIPKEALDKALGELNHLQQSKGRTPARTIRKQIQQTMQDYAHIFRHAERLEKGQARLHEYWRCFYDDLQIRETGLLWNNDLLEAIETENLLWQATASITAALDRRESRGAHFREDFPKRNNHEWLKHTLIRCESNANIHIAYRPVRLHNGADEVAVALEERLQ